MHTLSAKEIRTVLQISIFLWLALLVIWNPAYSAIITKSGDVSGEAWTTGNTYHVTADVSVLSGNTLTIQAGIFVKFDAGT